MFTFLCWRITFKTFGINHVSKLSWLLKADPDTYSHLPFSRNQHDSGLTIFRDHFSATKKKNLFFKNWSIVDSQNIYWYIHTYVHAYKDAFLLQVNTRYWLWFSVVLVFFTQLRLTLLWPTGTVAHQAPLSKGFSRQDRSNGLPFPSPGIEPTSRCMSFIAGGLYCWASEESPPWYRAILAAHLFCLWWFASVTLTLLTYPFPHPFPLGNHKFVFHINESVLYQCRDLSWL